jgi:hypothetical protein
MKQRTKLLAILFAGSAVLLCSAASFSQGKNVGSHQVYVPAYSSIYHGDKNREVNLAVTLSVRNTDFRKSLTVSSIDYYDEKGKKVRSYLSAPFTLAPLETRSFVVRESDTEGGLGASFIVVWKSSEKKISLPVIESIMISTAMQQGISFTSRGIELE